jgi:hypothetical protein
MLLNIKDRDAQQVTQAVVGFLSSWFLWYN